MTLLGQPTPADQVHPKQGGGPRRRWNRGSHSRTCTRSTRAAVGPSPDVAVAPVVQAGPRPPRCIDPMHGRPPFAPLRPDPVPGHLVAEKKQQKQQVVASPRALRLPRLASSSALPSPRRQRGRIKRYPPPRASASSPSPPPPHPAPLLDETDQWRPLRPPRCTPSAPSPPPSPDPPPQVYFPHHTPKLTF